MKLSSIKQAALDNSGAGRLSLPPKDAAGTTSLLVKQIFNFFFPLPLNIFHFILQEGCFEPSNRIGCPSLLVLIAYFFFIYNFSFARHWSL